MSDAGSNPVGPTRKNMKTEQEILEDFIKEQGLEYLKRIKRPAYIPTKEWYKEMQHLALTGKNYDPRWMQEMSDPKDSIKRRILEGKILIDRHDACTDHLFVNPDDIEWFAKMIDGEGGSQTDVYATMDLWAAKIVSCEFVEPGFLMCWCRWLYDKINVDERYGTLDKAVSIVCIKFNEKLRNMKMVLT
jgi:hypothetical protein